MPKLYRQISYGIDEIIQKCGADIHSTEDWETIFLLLKTAGAGLILEKTVENREIVGDGDNISCATSETDLSQRKSFTNISNYMITQNYSRIRLKS